MVITKEELGLMYSTMTTKEIRNKLGGICQSRLYKLLAEAGIEQHRKNKPRVHIKIVEK